MNKLASSMTPPSPKKPALPKAHKGGGLTVEQSAAQPRGGVTPKGSSLSSESKKSTSSSKETFIPKATKVSSLRSTSSSIF